MSNNTKLQPIKVRLLLSKIDSVYPTWPQTLQFALDVKKRTAPNRDYLYYADVANVVEEIGEHFGDFQDKECVAMKDQLMEAEQPGSPGRVRLADFYKLAKQTSDGLYSESRNYLRDLGALDESDPANPRVLSSNYIYGPSNCIASSNYYSVCCRNECESLLSQLEINLQRYDATPTQLTSMVAALSSRTQLANRTLSPWLLARLDEVAKHHGGRVPLHGRLFSQWMHYAYPRECAYPYVAGAVSPTTIDTVLSDPNVKDAIDNIVASAEEMDQHIEEASNMTFQEYDDDISMWTLEEELLVAHPKEMSADTSAFFAFTSVRGVAFVASVFVVSQMLRGQSSGMFSSKSHFMHEKYMV
jgi:hypothetical protein